VDLNVPNITKALKKEAEKKGEDGKGMHAFKVPVCFSLVVKNYVYLFCNSSTRTHANRSS